MKGGSTSSPPLCPPRPMETHELLSGRTLQFNTETDELEAFIEKAREQAEDPDISSAQFMALVYGPENPLIEQEEAPVVTDQLRRHPVHAMLLDLFDRKRIQEGSLDLESARARFTMTVRQAAEKLGLAPSSVRRAIAANRLSAWRYKEGFMLSPDQVEVYQQRIANR